MDTSTKDLIKYSDGTDTGVDLTIAGANAMDSRTGVTGPPTAGTPAADLFNITGLNLNDGLIYENTGSTTITLSGLDPAKVYDIALYGDRSLSTDGVERFTLGGADSAVNSSSTGIDSAYITDMETRPNASSGNVVRWTEINPGSDGIITVDIDPEVSSAGNLAYLTAVRLAEHLDLDMTIVNPTGAKHSSVNLGRSASHTINGSGLGDASIVETEDPIPDTWPTHTNVVGDAGSATMWQSGKAGPEGVEWAMYDLGRTYTIYGLHQWNYNEGSPADATGNGIKNVTIKFATNSAGYDAGDESDGSWGSGTSTIFARASSANNYTGQTIWFEPVQARYVLFDTESTYNATYKRTGLSEIRFMHYDPKGTLICIQ